LRYGCLFIEKKEVAMQKFTRRRFLEDSALATAFTLAMSQEPVWAAKKDKAAKAKSGDALQVAVIGVGGRGAGHIEEYLAHPEAHIAYVVDTDEAIGKARAEHIAKKQGSKPKFVQDLRKALDDKSVDCVSIATPNHWHALAAIWAMQAGKDVYVEKPVSHDVAEGRSMVATARKYNRVCQAGTQCRSMQGTIDAIKFVQDGKIGVVNLARGLCYKRRPSIGPKGKYDVPKTVDYNIWCGPARMLPLTRPKFHYDWHWQREWGNGDMGNQGPHQMDICRWGLDLNRLADSAIAFGGRLGYVDAGDVANTEVGIFDFGDKSIVFEVRGLQTDPFRGASVGVVFYGSEGYVVLDNYNGGAAFDPKGKLITKFQGGGDHFGNFLGAVKAHDPKRLRADILEGHLSCAHSHLANVSYYLGKPASLSQIKETLGGLKNKEDLADCLDRTVKHLKDNGVDLEKTPMSLGPMLKIDSNNETILDNPNACELLSRECRAPFIVPKPSDV
jgi:predicted dehydrogenase